MSVVTEAPPSNYPRIAGERAWCGLTSEHQAAIGAAAIEMVAAWVGLDAHCGPHRDDEPISPMARAFEAADRCCSTMLQDAVEAALPELADDGDTDRPLPAALGQVCLRCGCSLDDGCTDGCGWARPGLCTSCARMTAE